MALLGLFGLKVGANEFVIGLALPRQIGYYANLYRISFTEGLSGGVLGSMQAVERLHHDVKVVALIILIYIAHPAIITWFLYYY